MKNEKVAKGRIIGLAGPCFTIKGGSRRAEKSRKVLMMMMKAAKLGLAGPGAGQEQGWSKARAGLKHEQGRT